MLNRKSNSIPPCKTSIYRAEIQKYCDLCGEQWKGKHYAEGKDYQILLCDRCGLIWTNPLRYDHAAEKVKSPTTFNYPGEDVYLSNVDSQKKRFRKQLEIFIKIKKVDVSDLKSLRVLEVGSGLGFFLDVCEEVGIPAEGCDIAEKAVRYANRNRERVRLGTLDSYYQDESFDAIFAFNLIEHLPHPADFFTKARSILKQGGMIILETPIQQSLFHEISRLGYLLSNHRLKFFGVRPSRHIYKWSKKTFKFICDDMGFRNLFQRNISSPFGEIWGQSSIVSLDYKFLYRLTLPIVFTIAKATRQENRLLIILQKL